MVLPDWTEVSNSEGVSWLRKECKIPVEFTIEPIGSTLPTSGSRDKLPFSTLSLLEGGVRFPLEPLLVECLSRWGAFTTQCSANVYRIVMGVCALNRILEFDLGYNEIMYCYSFVRTKTGLSYLAIRPNRNYLVTNLPDSSSGKEKHYVNISGPLIDPDSEFASSFPVGFGNKASKKVNRGFQLPVNRKKLVHQVWQYSDRSAHLLLQYTPRYKSFISHHKNDVTLSSTETSSNPGEEKSVPSETEGDKSSSPVLEFSSEDSQRTPSVDLSSFSSFESSKTQSVNLISDSESSVDMERKIPSVTDILKRKALSTSASPKDKRVKVSNTVNIAKGKDGVPEERPSRSKTKENAKELEATKNTNAVKDSEAIRNTEVEPIRPPRGNPNEGPHKGVDVWRPKLIRVDQGSSRPILPSDTVEDPLVALGLSDVFLLPKDKGKYQAKSLSQVRELGLTYVGQTVNTISELYRRCMGYEDLLRSASKREGMVKTELSKQTEKLKASTEYGEEMEGKLKEVELRLIKGSRLLTEAKEDLVKTKNECRVLSKSNTELKKQVAEFPAKLIAEYNAGAEQGVETASKEIPEILEAQWADGFRRAWTYALQMAKVETASDLFNRCDEAIDLARSKIIGEQALAELETSSTSALLAVNPAATEAPLLQMEITKVTEEISGAQEKEKDTTVKASSGNPPI